MRPMGLGAICALFAACSAQPLTLSDPPRPGGTPARAGEATVIFADDFESGTLAPEWFTGSTNQGRIEVAPGGPSGSAFAVSLDDVSGDGIYSLNELILELDVLEPMVRGDDVTLVFTARDHSDEAHADDAVSVSNDGATWHTVYDLGSALTSSWTEHRVDLGGAVLDHGLDPDNLLVRLSQYDNYSIPTDGVSIDEVRVEAAASMPILFEEAFDNGIPGTWTATSTNDGRIQTELDPSTGETKVVMDDAVSGGSYSLNTLTFSPWGQYYDVYEHIELRFTAAETRDEPHTDDAVSIADHNGVWHDVVDLGTALSAVPTEIRVDLDPVIVAQGLDRTTLQVRFSQYDNYPAPTDGIELYDVAIHGRPLTAPAVGVLVTVGDAIERYDLDGTLLETLTVPVPATSDGPLRGIAQELGTEIYAFNGTETPSLSASFDGVWDEATADGWSTVDDPHSGGIDTVFPYVFVTDMDTGGVGAPQGLLRFDGPDTVLRFGEDHSFVDVAASNLNPTWPWNTVYALTDGSPAEVHAFSVSYPSDDLFPFVVPDPDPVGVEADYLGNLYVAYASGEVVRYEGGYHESARLDVGIGALGDIALSQDGWIAVTQDTGFAPGVALLDTTLTTVHAVFTVGDPTVEVSPSVAFDEDWTAVWDVLPPPY